MQILIVEHIQNAYHSLKTTRLRTLLTTLGVAIGVASITTVLSLSGGITQIVSSQVDALGGNVAVLRPGIPSKSLDAFSNPNDSQSYTTSTLSEEDYNSITEMDDVDTAAPLMVINGTLKAGNNTSKSAPILATTPGLEDIAGLPVGDGQFIDKTTNRDTAVIGNQLSIDLFGTDQSIGQTFRVHGQVFTVIGILKHLNNPINYNNIDFDHTAIISLESGKSFHQGVAQIQQIDIRAKSIEKLPGVINTITNKISKNHGGEKDFSILTGKEIAEPTSKFYYSLTGVMTTIAAISLIVGGIGIMNIMLVGVAERTREIGLRKSVGASNGNIIWQFITEALIISLIGGILGYGGGYLVAFIISTTLTFSPAFTWQIAVIALATSIIVGCIFGIYPALRAARKDPIESLRHHN
jgi:putative ABC transport system permease protein